MMRTTPQQQALVRFAPTPGPQRDRIFSKGPSDVLNHSTSEIASGTEPGINATKKFPAKLSNAPGRH